MSRFRLYAAMMAAICLLLIASLSATSTGATSPSSPLTARQATPTTYSCDTAGTPAAATPAMGGMSMGSGTPAAITMDFDQTYIDMMLPHHASVIALSEAALPRLQNSELQTIAMNIISSQAAELEELSSLRQQFYGSTTPETMDIVMDAMAQYMPAAHDLMMADTAMMDSDALVAAFCAQDNADLAFIDLVIPHHQSAIAASEAAVNQATHPETREFADRVIVAQQAEIEQMTSIRAMLTATPTP